MQREKLRAQSRMRIECLEMTSTPRGGHAAYTFRVASGVGPVPHRAILIRG